MVTRHTVRKQAKNKVLFCPQDSYLNFKHGKVAGSFRNHLRVHQISFACIAVWLDSDAVLSGRPSHCNVIGFSWLLWGGYIFTLAWEGQLYPYKPACVTDPDICSLSYRNSDVILTSTFSHTHICDLLGENLKLIYDASYIMWRVHVINWVPWQVQTLIPSTHHQSHAEKFHLRRGRTGACDK